ncbi:neurobeachin-like [Chiloscyllium plagiosum]|uniref:neurobeachin-like n=1 Tax=Chiloscyllium plagiosum TaxID=36176 RepID=UPI001CB839DA|nr:neurobeachin-like [Chiloscyllium plagiosum]
MKSKKTFRTQAIVNQNAETELMLEGDDDTVSLLQEKEIDNLAGPVVLSTPAQLIAPVVVAKGTLSITTTEIYFEVDEDDQGFKKIDPKQKHVQQYPKRWNQSACSSKNSRYTKHQQPQLNDKCKF